MTRNPLVGIKTYAQLFPSRGTSEEFRALFSRPVGREIGRIDVVLDRFRTMSRASHHPTETGDVSAPRRHTLETLRAQMGGPPDPPAAGRRRGAQAGARQRVSVAAAFREPVLKCHPGD